MPEMNGVDATKKIREYEGKHKLRRTPIIALSGEIREKEKLFAAKVDEFVAKPVSLNQIEATLKNWIQLTKDPQ